MAVEACVVVLLILAMTSTNEEKVGPTLRHQLDHELRNFLCCAKKMRCCRKVRPPYVELRAVLTKCAKPPLGGCKTRTNKKSAGSVGEDFDDDEPLTQSVVNKCYRKIVLTIKIQNSGETNTKSQYIVVDHVYDSTTLKTVRLFNPYVLKLKQEHVTQAYPLEFLDFVNSEATEQIYNKHDGNYTGCSTDPTTATCGVVKYKGKIVPYSQGFCCSCDPQKNAEMQPEAVAEAQPMVVEKNQPVEMCEPPEGRGSKSRQKGGSKERKNNLGRKNYGKNRELETKVNADRENQVSGSEKKHFGHENGAKSGKLVSKGNVDRENQVSGSREEKKYFGHKNGGTNKELCNKDNIGRENQVAGSTEEKKHFGHKTDGGRELGWKGESPTSGSKQGKKYFGYKNYTKNRELGRKDNVDRENQVLGLKEAKKKFVLQPRGNSSFDIESQGPGPGGKKYFGLVTEAPLRSCGERILDDHESWNSDSKQRQGNFGRKSGPVMVYREYLEEEDRELVPFRSGEQSFLNGIREKQDFKGSKESIKDFECTGDFTTISGDRLVAEEKEERIFSPHVQVIQKTNFDDETLDLSSKESVDDKTFVSLRPNAGCVQNIFAESSRRRQDSNVARFLENVKDQEAHRKDNRKPVEVFNLEAILKDASHTSEVALQSDPRSNNSIERKGVARAKRQVQSSGVQKRGGQNCADRYTPPHVNAEAYHESTHCLRFSPIWYGVYKLEKPLVEQETIVQLFEKYESETGQTRWKDVTNGKKVRLGTFSPSYHDETPMISFNYQHTSDDTDFSLDITKYRLLMPEDIKSCDPRRHPEARGDPKEHLLVNKKMIALSGEQCDVAGVGFEAFYMQPNRCSTPRGSCLHHQPKHMWQHDKKMERLDKPGCYFLKYHGVLGVDPIKINASNRQKFLTLNYYGHHESVIEVEINADFNAVLSTQTSAVITEIYIDSTSGSKTYVTIKVTNSGLLSGRVYVRIADCPFELERDVKSKLVVIAPQNQHVFSLMLTSRTTAEIFYCSVEAVNAKNDLVALRRIRVQNLDRCICSWHCLCACIGSRQGLKCIPMQIEHYHAAGFLGGLPVVSYVRRFTTTADDVLTLVFFVLLFFLFTLFVLGVTKALIGICCLPVGLWGLNILLDLPKPMCRYYEGDLRGRSVVYDGQGWPVHPDTGEKVRNIPKTVEFCTNVIFFYTYPCIILLLVFRKLCCPFYTYEFELLDSPSGNVSVCSRGCGGEFCGRTCPVGGRAQAKRSKEVRKKPRIKVFVKKSNIKSTEEGIEISDNPYYCSSLDFSTFNQPKWSPKDSNQKTSRAK